MNKPTARTYGALHVMLVLFSVTDVLSKAASAYALDDVRFYLCYGGALVVLGLYAIGWQQVIKRLPLSTAFANKAVTVFWGLVWGVLFFGEQVTLGKVIGVVVVMAGVVLFTRADVTSERAEEGDRP